MNNLLIALDFDGTCVRHRYPYVGETLPNCVEVLRKLINAGHLICLDTMRDWINPSPLRENQSVMDDALKWFEIHNIPVFSVQPHTHASSWTKSTKCHADISIDDRNLGIPLDKYGSVDWVGVESLLKQKGIL